ncbi:AIR carboxylase family protein [Candidatus Woesearchaeota archaeon]|nr:AIR carboxylase family protein [Candidatus Woesearchaeota archaeon]
MAEILVIFGSASDKRVFDEITKNADCQLEICSAHRNPEKVKKIVSETKAKVIIAGAGLSAALPGVVASYTIKPVIGVPVNSNYEGLDSLLSIAQMPPNIPVIAVGVDNAKEAAGAAKRIVKGFKGINLVNNNEKAEKVLNDFGVEFSVGEAKENFINIDFVDLKDKNNYFTINVPMLENSRAKDSLQLMEATKNGLWVGLNRAENAAIAAIEILNAADGKYSNKLNEFREALKK